MNPKKQAQVADLTRRAVAAGRAERFDEADAALRKALRLDPKAPGALLASAVLAWRRDHDPVTALKFANRARAVAPNEPAVHLRRGELLAASGRRAEAGEAARTVLALAPRMVGAYMLLSNVGELPADALDRLEALAEDPTLEADARRRAFYLCGTLLERAERYHEAFARYAEGNRQVTPARGIDAVVGALRTLTDRQRRLRFPALPARPRAPRPIFVVGMPRSGSTLVEQILTAADDVASIGESPHLRQLYDRCLAGPIAAADAGADALIDVPETALAAFRDGYLDHLARTGAAHVVDKQLDHFALVPLLRAAFPDAAILHTRRHPLDVAVSCFATPFADVPYAYRLEDIAAYHRAYTEIVAHWDADDALGVDEVVYEALVADPEVEVRALVARAGLPFEPAHLRPERSKNAVSTASIGQVREAFSRSSVGRWRRFESELSPLVEAFEEHLGAAA